jgi:putative FmdB family regulatory protein
MKKIPSSTSTRDSSVPIYEYRCQKCRHTFEKIQKFSDAPVKKCPECGGPVEKLLSPSTVQFKGSGWYVTDYARKAESSKSGASESGSTKSEKDGAKPAEKSDRKTTEAKTEASRTKSHHD